MDDPEHVAHRLGQPCRARSTRSWPRKPFEASIARLTTDILISADPHGNLVPRLARQVPTRANGGISADGLTIVYHLRAGVLWQDGAPFTSRDVRFTYDAIMNPNNDVISRHGYDIVSRVETPGPLTVVFHLKQPFAPFVSVVFGESDSPYAILPEHLLAKYPNLNNVRSTRHPSAPGPFKFVRWLRGDRIEFVRNGHYFSAHRNRAHHLAPRAR